MYCHLNNENFELNDISFIHLTLRKKETNSEWVYI